MKLEQLIILVRKYPCLWDKDLAEYRKQNTRDIAWKKISGELKKEVEYLKGEWKKLLDSHRQAMLRRKEKISQGVNMRPWKYEALMSFLLTDLTAERAQSFVDNVGIEETGDLEDTLGRTVDSEIEEVELEDGTGLAIRRKHSRRNSNANKGYLQKEHDIDKLITFLKEKNRGGKPRGELDYFFASACESTKRLPRRLQLKVKQEIMTTILNAEVECLDSESSTITSPSHIAANESHSSTHGLRIIYPAWCTSKATSNTYEQSTD